MTFSHTIDARLRRILPDLCVRIRNVSNYHVSKNISFAHESERAKVILHFRELTERLEYCEKMQFMLENQTV